MDPHNELHPHVDHYIGIDVGTGSARACIMNEKGDIVGLASENIGLWQPESGYYVRLVKDGCPCYLKSAVVFSWGALRMDSADGKLGTIYCRHLEMHLLLHPHCHAAAQHRPHHNSRHRL